MYNHHLIHFKMEWNYFEKVHRNKITSKSKVQAALVFDISKTFQKDMSNRQLLFVFKNKSKSARRICIIFPSKLHQKYIETKSVFWPSKLGRKKYVVTASIFWSSKLCRTKHVKTTSIFQPSKLRRKKYVETTSIFWSS